METKSKLQISLEDKGYKLSGHNGNLCINNLSSLDMFSLGYNLNDILKYYVNAKIIRNADGTTMIYWNDVKYIEKSKLQLCLESTLQHDVRPNDIDENYPDNCIVVRLGNLNELFYFGTKLDALLAPFIEKIETEFVVDDEKVIEVYVYFINVQYVE